MKIENRELKGLLKSFVYAARGLVYCIKNERNMRIHITAAAIVLSFSFIYDLNRTQYGVLILIMGLVMVCELINTAMEALVNLGSDSYDSLARIAKDVAAGAVLMCSIAAVMVGVSLFGHPYKLLNALIKILTNPILIIYFVLLTTLGILFIFKVPKKRPHIKNRNDEVKVYIPKSNAISDKTEYSDDVKIYRLKSSKNDSKN